MADVKELKERLVKLYSEAHGLEQEISRIEQENLRADADALKKAIFDFMEKYPECYIEISIDECGDTSSFLFCGMDDAEIEIASK